MSERLCVGVHSEDDPVPADGGYLCRKCFGRLRRKLQDLPTVATWLEVNMTPGGSANERVSGSREDPIPLRTDVLDLIGPSSLHAPEVDESNFPSFLLWEDGVTIGVYSSWRDAQTARAEEMRLAGVEPDIIRVLAHRYGSKEFRTELNSLLKQGITEEKIHAAREKWQIRPTQRGGTDQTGVEAWIADLRYWCERISEESNAVWSEWYDRNTLSGLAAWLLTRLHWISQQPWVDEFNDAIHELHSRAHKVAPWREETRRDPKPCERCGVRAIVMHMSQGRSTCEERLGGCGRIMTWDHQRKDTAC